MVKFTVIHTNQQTMLTITPQGSDPVSLDQMKGDGSANVLRTVRGGATETVSVGAGLYRIAAESVRVTAVSEPLSIVVVNGKDDPPEHLRKAFGDAPVRAFLRTMGEALSVPTR